MVADNSSSSEDQGICNHINNSGCVVSNRAKLRSQPNNFLHAVCSGYGHCSMSIVKRISRDQSLVRSMTPDSSSRSSCLVSCLIPSICLFVRFAATRRAIRFCNFAICAYTDTETIQWKYQAVYDSEYSPSLIRAQGPRLLS